MSGYFSLRPLWFGRWRGQPAVRPRRRAPQPTRGRTGDDQPVGSRDSPPPTSRPAPSPIPQRCRKNAPCNFSLYAWLREAADGTRTHDLLHGKQWRNPRSPLVARDRGVGDTRGLPAITVGLGNEWVIESRRSAADGQRVQRSLNAAKHARAARKRRCPYVVRSRPTRCRSRRPHTKAELRCASSVCRWSDCVPTGSTLGSRRALDDHVENRGGGPPARSARDGCSASARRSAPAAAVGARRGPNPS
jgi:hypothetical protein